MGNQLQRNYNQEAWKQIKESIKEAADPVVVARAIQMDIEDPSAMSLESRKRISVLCPGHDDHHYGSCYLTKGGCKCFVCGKTYDVFDMVRLHLGVKFYEAVGIVADLCGGRERFFQSASTNGNHLPPILSSSDMKLLGLHNSPVYAVRSIVPDYAAPPPEKGYRQEWYPGDPAKEEENYVVVMECVCKSPIHELPTDEYKRLIRDKSMEALEEYREEQKELFSFSRSCARSMNKSIRRLEELFIEHGGSLKELDAHIRQ